LAAIRSPARSALVVIPVIGGKRGNPVGLVAALSSRN